ncbi:hypothetical protein BC829DRAFT_432389 [Chytridium lagenaria]|nr:hypothetical protein BC829DRAFT_432389 [Chytridium lagenaria]
MTSHLLRRFRTGLPGAAPHHPSSPPSPASLPSPSSFLSRPSSHRHSSTFDPTSPQTKALLQAITKDPALLNATSRLAGLLQKRGWIDATDPGKVPTKWEMVKMLGDREIRETLMEVAEGVKRLGGDVGGSFVDLVGGWGRREGGRVVDLLGGWGRRRGRGRGEVMVFFLGGFGGFGDARREGLKGSMKCCEVDHKGIPFFYGGDECVEGFQFYWGMVACVESNIVFGFLRLQKLCVAFEEMKNA